MDTSGYDPWRTRRRRRLARAVATGALATLAAGMPIAVGADATLEPQPGNPPSAIGNEAVYAIAVAPDYARSGLVAVMSTPMTSCRANCQHLWVSHDGGSTWAVAAASGWDGGKPMIGLDGSGHDLLFTSTNALERSDDGGQTWTPVGSIGFSSLSARFASDGTIAVGGTGVKPDYIYRNGTTRNVTGSGGTLWDQYFMLSPTWPSGGRHAPALLAAADSRTQYPIIQRCDAQLTCTGATSLSGSQPFSAPATLLPSTGYADDGVVFAQTGRGVYKSTDGGLSFTPFVLGQPGATTTTTPMMALAPGYSEAGPVRTAYVAVFQAFVQGKTSHTAGGIYRTTDGGATWSPLDSPGPFDQGAFGVAVAPDGRLFGGYMSTTTGHAGLLCSTDGGASWKVSCPAVGTHQRVATSSTKGGACAATGCASGAAQPAGGAQQTAGAAADPGHAGVAAAATGNGVGLAGVHSGGGLSRGFTWAMLALALVLSGVASAVIRRRRSRHTAEERS